MSDVTTEDRKPPEPKTDTSTNGQGDHMDEMGRMKSGFERRIAELTGKIRDLEAAVETATGRVTTAEAAHAAELAKRDEAIAVAVTAAEGARRESALIRHGIDDAEARDFVEYTYAKQPPRKDGTPPAFSDWLKGYVESDPAWLRPYRPQPQAVKVETQDPTQTTTVADPKSVTVPPIKSNTGAGRIGGKGEPTAAEMMAWDNATYVAWREANMGDGKKG